MSGNLKTSARMRFWCDRCNNWYYAFPSTIRAGCLHKCDKGKRAWITKRLKVYNKFLYDDLADGEAERIKSGEIGATDKARFHCGEHGEYLHQLSLHSKHNGCPQCKANARGKSKRRRDYPFMDEIRPDYQEKIKHGEIVQETPVPFFCDKHGEYWAKLASKLNGSKCPLCGMEKHPRSLYEWLSTICDNIVVNDRKQIFPLEIDFFLPDYNVGIEFNDIESHQTFFEGESINIQYHNGANYECGGKTPDYHYKKFLACKEKGIRLIQIWDIEWQDEKKKFLLQNIIRNAICEAKLEEKDHNVMSEANKLLKTVADFTETGNEIEVFVPNDYFDGAMLEESGWKKIEVRPAARYYDYSNKKVYDCLPTKNATRKELNMTKKMSRYFTSGITIYRKEV